VYNFSTWVTVSSFDVQCKRRHVGRVLRYSNVAPWTNVELQIVVCVELYTIRHIIQSVTEYPRHENVKFQFSLRFRSHKVHLRHGGVLYDNGVTAPHV